MKKLILPICLLSGTLLVASCNSENSNENTGQAQEAVATTGEPVIGGDSILNDDQKNLFEHIARHNMLQMELGRLAAQRGTSDDVKQYGQQMVDFHTTKQQELQEMAQAYQVTMEQGLDEDYRDDVDEVQKAKPENFDEEYWENVTDSQKALLDEYDSALKDAMESDASAFVIWARKSMKELRAQMEQAITFDKRRRDRA